MAKKVFIVLVILFLIMLLAFIVHSFSLDKGSLETEKTELSEEQGVVKETEGQQPVPQPEGEKEMVGKLSRLLDGETAAIKGVTLNSTTAQILYYQKRNFLLTDFKGKTKSSLGGHPFISVEGIKWNSSRDKALVRDQNRYFVYDLNKNVAIELAENIEYAVWFNYFNQDKIAYKFYDKEIKKRKLAIADSNGENKELLVEELPYNRVGLKIPANGSRVCYHRDPDANFEANLTCVELKTGQTEVLHQGSFAADYKWANNGNRLLVSYVSEQIGNKMVLGSMNGRGGEFKSLNFPTSVEKCAWSKDNRKVYCAMMVYREKGIILPNDWSAKKHHSIDTFWEIDVESGRKKRIAKSAEMVAVDAENLFLDSNEKHLFFTDRITHSVYSISLR